MATLDIGTSVVVQLMFLTTFQFLKSSKNPVQTLRLTIDHGELCNKV